MNRFRHKYFFSWLALFALTVQMLFAFGHVHVAGLHIKGKLVLALEPLIVQSASHCDHSSHQHVRFSVLEPASQPLPAPDHKHDDEYCPTCWLTSIASALVLPGDVEIVQNTQFSFVHFEQGVSIFAVARVKLPYQVRAPPLA